MRTPRPATGLLTALAALAAGGLGLAGLAWWFLRTPEPAPAPRLPGMDRRGAAARAGTVEQVRIGEQFRRLSDAPPPPLPGRWPQFRGVGRDNIVADSAPLADSWPAAGPPVLWSLPLGEGHAAPAVWDGRVYLLDYDEANKADSLRCFALADGRELWRRGYRVHLKRNHGFSRTVPATDGRVVVTLGPQAHVMAVSAADGELLWSLDLVRDWGATVPLWYAGQCPLLDDGTVVLAPAGKALLLGVEAASGRVLWQTPNPPGWKMSHSSVMPARIGGRRMYLYSAVGGVAGVAADGPERGTILWQSTAWNRSVIAPSPVGLPDGRVFLTAGYGAGSMMLQVETHDDGSFSVRELWARGPADSLASEQQTPILLDGHLFAVMPKDGGELRGQFVCARPDAPGDYAWTSGKTERFGLGPFLVADGKIILLRDDGLLVLLRATPRGCEPLASARVLDGHDAWGPLALVGRRLLLRDSTRLLCLDLGPGDADARPSTTASP